MKLGQRELEELNDVETLCIFKDQKERKAFRTQVCSGFGCSSFKDLDLSQFDEALEKAKEILRARGEQVFKEMITKSSIGSRAVSRIHELRQNDGEIDTSDSRYNFSSGGFY